MERKRHSKRVLYACSYIFNEIFSWAFNHSNYLCIFWLFLFQALIFFKVYGKLMSKSGAASVIKNPLQRKIGDRSGGLELKP